MHDDGFAKRLDEITDLLGGIGKACAAADISYPTLGRWKAGTSEPLAVNLSKLARQAGVSMDWLIYGDGEMGGRQSASGIPNNNEYAHVPFYRTEASAGHGTFLTDEEASSYLSLPTKWLKKKGYALKDLAGLVVSGDSMEPTILDKSEIVIHTQYKEPSDGNIYVIRFNERLWVKRIQWLLDGGLRLISDNSDYEPMDIPRKSLSEDNIDIIGQVVRVEYDLVR